MKNILFIAFALISTQFTVLADEPTLENKDGIISLTAADKILYARGYPVSNEHFKNEDNYDLGLGEAKAGLIWGSAHVSTQSKTSFTLSANADRPDRKYKKNDEILKFKGLTWDQKKQVYTGFANILNSSQYAQCPNRWVDGTVEVKVFNVQPFVGAWYSIVVKWDTPFVNDECVDTGITKPATLVLARKWTNIELLTAVDQGLKMGRAAQARFRIDYAEMRIRVTNEDTKKSLEDYIANYEKSFDDFNRIYDQLDFVLGNGGNLNKKHYDKPEPLGDANPALFTPTIDMFNAVMTVTEQEQLIADKLKETAKK